MSAPYMLLQVLDNYKIFPAKLTKLLNVLVGVITSKASSFLDWYHYNAALKNFKCLLAPKFQRFACHHPLYQYPRSDSRFWLLLSFLVSYITRVELRCRANLTMNIRTIHFENFCQTVVNLDSNSSGKNPNFSLCC